MKIFLSGGTGVIGRRVVPALVDAGHDVTVLARCAERDPMIAELGATPVRADLFDVESLYGATSGHDTVVNLATHIPPMKRASRAGSWAENDRIRTEGVSNLVEAATRNRVERFVQESITLMYDDGGDAWIDEDHPRATHGLGAPVEHAEHTVEGITAGGGVGVVLRFGSFYAADSSHTLSQASMFRRRINPFFGAADGYVSLIGMPAAARAVVGALELPAGVYNVVDDDPPTRRELGLTVSRRIGRRPPRQIPAGLIRRLNKGSDILMRSQRASNRKLQAASDWRPDHSGADGLAAVVEEILS